MIAEATAVLCAGAALLLAGSGVAKLRHPDPAAATIGSLARSVPMRRRAPAARLVGVAELGVAAGVLAAGGRVTLALLAAVFLAFTGVAVRLVAREQPVACGCFGRDDTPMTYAHVVLDAVVVVVATVGAVLDVPAVFDRSGGLATDVLSSLITGAFIVLLAWLAYLSITALPALAAARRLVEAS